MRHALVLVMSAALLTLVVAAGCKSSKAEDVKTSYRSQWTTVNADTKATTEAAREVLEAEGLKEITAESTAVDGRASGKKADGTKINVAIEKAEGNKSQLSVNVGMMGDPALGTDLVTKIKNRAEGR